MSGWRGVAATVPHHVVVFTPIESHPFAPVKLILLLAKQNGSVSVSRSLLSRPFVSFMLPSVGPHVLS